MADMEQISDQINACKGSMRKEIDSSITAQIRSFKKPKPPMVSTSGGYAVSRNVVHSCINGELLLTSWDFRQISCACRPHALDNIIEAIDDTGIWPLHEKTRSINDILAGLARFKYVPPPNACTKCSVNITFKALIRTIKNYFDGLCLDCMDSSNPRTGTLATDYWLHNYERKWVANCRIKHDRNTWYFSYMGRPEQMEAHQREMQDRKNQRLREQAQRERAERERAKRSRAQAEENNSGAGEEASAAV